ncbi:MAG TPA: glycosyltransferase family 2 protein [Candidatus Dormibacteraeota bacterium]
MTAEPSVSLVVLNFNGRQHLATLLPAIAALDFPRGRLQVIVCDNGSSDGSADFVRSHPEVELVALDRNQGFAGGNNRGAAAASGEWIGFLNNDLRLEPNWLRDMLSTLDAHPDASAIASRIMSWDGSAVDFVGSGVNFQGHGYQIDFGRAGSDLERDDRRLLAPCGAAMLVRRDLFQRLEGWDEDFFAYFEDVDLGWRLNLLGHDVWYNPRATAYHRLHATTSRMRASRVRVLYERNALFVIYKCLDGANLAAALPAALYLLNERALLHTGVDRDEFAVDRADAEDQRSWLRRKLSRLRHGQPLPPDQAVVPRLALSHWVGLSEFAHALDRMGGKRRWLQDHRVRSDAEILPLMVDPLRPQWDDPRYVRFYDWLIRTLELDRRFAVSPRSSPRPAGSTGRPGK